jgi:hypothetical protein
MDERRGGSALFGSPVGIACFVVAHSSSNDDDDDGGERMETEDSPPEQSLLHLRAVDSHRTILSLSFSYPDLTPIIGRSGSTGTEGGSSFLLPLPPEDGGGRRLPMMLPHPGSYWSSIRCVFPLLRRWCLRSISICTASISAAATVMVQMLPKR